MPPGGLTPFYSVLSLFSLVITKRPQQDSNLRSRLRRALIVMPVT